MRHGPRSKRPSTTSFWPATGFRAASRRRLKAQLFRAMQPRLRPGSVAAIIRGREFAMASQRVLVTGGNGFVGCHVARALIARGAQVRALVRAKADLRALAGVDCELVTGDLRDLESLKR